jgi:hypothetical protein
MYYPFLFCFLAGLLAFTQVCGAVENQKKIEKQVHDSSWLLARTDSYAVHLFKGDYHPPGGPREGNNWKAGHYIAHIDKKTDKLTWLLVSGVAAKTTARITYSFKRIAGLLVAKEKLWVVLYISKRIATDAYDMRPDERTLQKFLLPVADDGRFVLEVYDLNSASFLDSYIFTEEPGNEKFKPHFFAATDKKLVLIKDELTPGPLKIADHGVKCFGGKFTLQDDKISVAMEKGL